MSTQHSYSKVFLLTLDKIINWANSHQAEIIQITTQTSGELLLRYKKDGQLSNAWQLPANISTTIIKDFKQLLINQHKHRLTRVLPNHAELKADGKQAWSIILHNIKHIPRQLKDWSISPASRVALYNLLTTGHGLWIIAGTEAALADRFAANLLSTFDPETQNIVAISSTHLKLKGVNQLPLPNSNDQWHSVTKALPAQEPDVIYLSAGQAEHLNPQLLNLANRKTIILWIKASNGGQALRRLATAIGWSAPALSQLQGVLSLANSQRLCPDCRESFQADTSLQSELSSKLGLDPSELDQFNFHSASGCPTCRHSGQLGHLYLVELADFSNATKNLTSLLVSRHFADLPHASMIETALNEAVAGNLHPERLKDFL